jgi:DNA-binding winged helix-turn-helix (wHTH) protein
LLRALAAEPARVFGKEELLRDVWGFKSMGRTPVLAGLLLDWECQVARFPD